MLIADVEADVVHHLLDGLHDPLVEERGGGERNLDLRRVACRRQQLLRLVRIVGQSLDVIRPTEMGRRQHLADDLSVAAENALHDPLLVDGISGCAPDIQVVEGRLVGIEAQIGEALRQRRQALHVRRILKLRRLIGVERDHQIRRPGLQVGHAR